MSDSPSNTSRVLFVVASVVVLLACWAAATWIIAYGLWIFVIGDNDSDLFYVAPMSAIAVAVAMTVGFWRLREVNGLWKALLWVAAGVVISPLVAWFLIMFVDDAF